MMVWQGLSEELKTGALRQKDKGPGKERSEGSSRQGEDSSPTNAKAKE